MRVMDPHRAFTMAMALVLIGAAGSSSAQDAAKGAALLADARKAVGGDERLRAVKTFQANGTFRRSAGNNTLEGDVEVLVELPDKLRRNESTGFAGGPTIERTEVLNGTDVWDENSGGGQGGFFIGGRDGGGGGGRFDGGGGRRFGDGNPGAGQGDQPGARGQRQIDPERLREAQRRARQADLSRLLLVWLLTSDAPVVWIGTAQAPEGTADVLEFTPQTGVATRLFLDSSTHMPLMLTWAGAAPRIQIARRGGASGDQAPGAGTPPAPTPQATIEMHLSEYKAVGGIKLPHVITRGTNGQTFEEWEVKSYKINPKFKENTFTK